MLIKSLKNNKVMGFARFEKKHEISIDELIDRSLNWSNQFLKETQGVQFHCLLQNTKGQFADIILAKDHYAMDRINDAIGKSETSQAMISALKPDTIDLTLMHILTSEFEAPDSFASIEIGFMKPVANSHTTDADILTASKQLEEKYLNLQTSTLNHFIGKTNSGRYTDVTFGRSLGSVRKTCFGFQENATAQTFLQLFDKSSFELDFWSVLA